MLNDEQINEILEKKLFTLAQIGGVIGSGISGFASGGILGGTAKSLGVASLLNSQNHPAVGKFADLDHKTDKISIQNKDVVLNNIEKYFGKSIIAKKDEEGITYIVGVKGGGFLSMNPCVIEILIRSDVVEVVAHAKEGSIKQNTCSKAIEALKNVLI